MRFPRRLEFHEAGHRWRATFEPHPITLPGQYVPDLTPAPSWVLECCETGDRVRGPVWRDEVEGLTEARLRLALHRYLELQASRRRIPA